MTDLGLQGSGATRPLRRAPKTSESVARQIVLDVVRGGLKPGAPLQPEAEMLRYYQISRASLREALRILEVHGLITIKPGPRGGPRVAEVGASDFGNMATFYYQVTSATFRELAEARLVIEPMMTRLAAQRRPEASINELASLVEAANALDGDDDGAHLELSRQFHGLIASMAGNKVLELISSSFEEIFSAYSPNALSAKENRNVARMHEKIFEAVIAGNADEAERRMRAHLAASNLDFEHRYPSLFDAPVHWI